MSTNNPNSGQQINPAWQEILNVLPTEFHSLVIPTLKKWDTGVQQKFAEIRSEFDEYKAFEPFVKNNIDPQYAEQAVMLADQLQRDPQKVIDQVNQAWNLGYLSKDEAEKLGQSSSQPGEDDGDLFNSLGSDDILKHPQVKAMADALNQLQTEFKTTKEQEEEQQALAEFESYLDELEKNASENNLPFNRTFVTALISQGIDGEAAVKQYHQVLAGSAVTAETPAPTPSGETPPVVMGGEGSTGSGTPDGSVDFGSLSRQQLNSTIEQMLAQQAQAGQG